MRRTIPLTPGMRREAGRLPLLGMLPAPRKPRVFYACSPHSFEQASGKAESGDYIDVTRDIHLKSAPCVRTGVTLGIAPRHRITLNGVSLDSRDYVRAVAGCLARGLAERLGIADPLPARSAQ